MRDIYRALSDPTRRGILRLLRESDLSAGEIAGNFPIAKPTLSRHFAVLKEADLIQGRREGTAIIYTLNVSVLEEAICHLLDAFSLEAKSKPKSATRCLPRPQRRSLTSPRPAVS